MSWRGACWRQLAAAVPAPRVPAATLACFTAARQTVGAGPAVVGASRRRVPPQALLVRTGRRCMSSAPALATKAGPPKKRRRGRERHAGSTATVKPGDWHCPNCGGMNFASRTSCFGCGAPKPEVGANTERTRCRLTIRTFEPLGSRRRVLPRARPLRSSVQGDGLPGIWIWICSPAPLFPPPLAETTTHARHCICAAATKQRSALVANGHRSEPQNRRGEGEGRGLGITDHCCKARDSEQALAPLDQAMALYSPGCWASTTRHSAA